MSTRKSAGRPRTAPVRGPVTGVRLPKELVIKAKHRALDEQKTLRDVVEAAIEEYLRGPLRR